MISNHLYFFGKKARCRLLRRIIRFLENIHSTGGQEKASQCGTLTLPVLALPATSDHSGQSYHQNHITFNASRRITTHLLEFGEEEAVLADNVSLLNQPTPRTPTYRTNDDENGTLHPKRALPLMTVLKKTATTLLIVKQLLAIQFTHFPSTASSTYSNYKFDIVSRPVVTLRQIYYGCKPFLARAPFLSALVEHHDLKLHSHQLRSSLQLYNRLEVTKGWEEEAEVESPQLAQYRSVSPSVIYECVGRMCEKTLIEREHLQLDAEGKALFSIRLRCTSSSQSYDSLSIFSRLVASHFRTPQLITTRMVEEVRTKLSDFLGCSTPNSWLPNAISIVALEKEGVFHQILQRLDAAGDMGTEPQICSESLSLPLSSSRDSPLETKRTSSRSDRSPTNPRDAFDSMVMDRLAHPHPSSSSPTSSFAVNSDSQILFLVCLKGFPCHSSRHLLRLLHQFHGLLQVASFNLQSSSPMRSSSDSTILGSSESIFEDSHPMFSADRASTLPHPLHPLRVPPIRCFVDCNPSGVLIMISLARSTRVVTGQAETACKLFPILWVGLLPSQLRLLCTSALHLQSLSTRDLSLLKTLHQNAKEWHESMSAELIEMSSSGLKAELQCLFNLV